MDYGYMGTQTPIFNSFIENMVSVEEKIAFSKAFNMLDYLFKITVPYDDLWFAILNYHAQYLSPDLLEKIGKNDEWLFISGEGVNERVDFPFYESFLKKYGDKIDWDILCQNYVVPEPIIRKFDEKINWSIISAQNLSDDFIIEFSSRLDWDVISSERMLTDDFIRRFEVELKWDLVSMRRLSEKIILEFSHKVNFYHLLVSPYRPRASFFADLLTRAYKIE